MKHLIWMTASSHMIVALVNGLMGHEVEAGVRWIAAGIWCLVGLYGTHLEESRRLPK